jgi:hypothetical protein
MNAARAARAHDRLRTAGGLLRRRPDGTGP